MAEPRCCCGLAPEREFKSEFLCFESQLGFGGVSFRTVLSDSCASGAARQHLPGGICSFVAVSHFALLLERLHEVGNSNCRRRVRRITVVV